MVPSIFLCTFTYYLKFLIIFLILIVTCQEQGGQCMSVITLSSHNVDVIVVISEQFVGLRFYSQSLLLRTMIKALTFAHRIQLNILWFGCISCTNRIPIDKEGNTIPQTLRKIHRSCSNIFQLIHFMTLRQTRMKLTVSWDLF